MKAFLSALVLFLFFAALPAWPAKIRFPDEELARETVLPLFQPVRAALRRNISLKYRFALSGGAAWGLDEPFYSIFYGEGRASFYWTETIGVNIQVIFIPPVLSAAGQKLRDEGVVVQQQGSGSQKSFFDAQKLLHPYIMTFINLQYTPFYGKISLAKQWAMNLSIYTRFGPGLIVFNEGTKLPSFNLGIGKMIFLNRFFALNGDLGFYSYYGPDPTMIPLTYHKGKEIPRVAYSALQPGQKSLYIQLTTYVGFVVLL